jgi:serine/threonine protein kinase
MSSEAPRTAPRQVGNYEIISKIAEGGMGSVFRAKHRDTGDLVAIKIITGEPARNPVLLKRFKQEFEAARQIDHPNVVKALDYSGEGPTPFLVMELVEGESLGQKVDRDGPLPEAEAVRLIGQVCEGLHRAHKQGLIHRDVKPDNILVTNDGVAKLTDLGLVKDVEADTGLTRTGRGLGTPHYMAPEQFRDAKNVDSKSDIYSLGATLYMVVTGATPFANTSPLDCWVKKTKDDLPEPKAVNPAVSGRVNWAICRAMRADKAARPANCREFMEDLTADSWKNAGSPSAAGPAPAAGADDMWYLVYKDTSGQKRTMKGTTDGIRKNVMSKALGDPEEILVGKAKAGPFQALKSVPAFRDLVVGHSGVIPRPSRPDAGRPAVGLPSPGSKAGRLSTSGVRPAPPASARVPVGRGSNPGDPLPPESGVGMGKRVFDPTADPPGPRWEDILLWVVAGVAVLAAAVGAYLVLFR